MTQHNCFYFSLIMTHYIAQQHSQGMELKLKKLKKIVYRRAD